MKFKLVQAFNLEYLRDELARKKLWDQFIDTYSIGNPEIPNSNIGKKWDKLNKPISKTHNPMAYDRIKKLVTYINGPNLKILNYGFGQAAFENELYKISRNFDLIGIDISAESVRKAKLRFKQWKFIVGKEDKIRKYKNYFDYIVCSEVLEHISPHNIFNVLNQFNNSLKSGGHLLVSIPLNEGLYKLIESGQNPNSHSRVYTPQIIKAELWMSKFRIIKFEYLYAFHKYYSLKNLLVRIFFKYFINPNVMIILAQKT